MKKYILLLTLILCTNLFGGELKSITFNQHNETSFLELTLDKEDIKASKFHVKEDKQIILDLGDVAASERVLRAFDTSEFSGSVIFVSAYKKPGSTNDLRVAIQLRENVRSVFRKAGDKFTLEVENRFGVFTQKQIEEDLFYGVSQGKSAKSKVADSKNAILKETTSTTSEEKDEIDPSKVLHIPKSDSVIDILENLTLSGKKKYIGNRITVTVSGVQIEDVFKMISEASGFNVILSEDVKRAPPLTLNLINTPWDQVLDTIMEINKLIATKNGNILIVNTLEKATEEREASNRAKVILKEDEPLLTKIFPISYAKLDDLGPIITKYLTPKRGAVSKDERTNSLIVKETAEGIDRIKKIIEVLDTQTPQILIEAKIVEVVERYAKEIGLKKGFSFGYDPITKMEELTATGPGFSFSSAPDPTTRNLFGIQIASFGRIQNLDLTLQLMESESKGKIVSSPKVITQNKKAAKISTSDQTSFAVSTSAGGTSTSGWESVEASLELNVLPQVTNEGSIVMEVSISKSQFGARPSESAPPNLSTRSMNTNVLVDNGSTIVIGGIYAFSKSESHSGIPFLKDIPLIGWLFRTPYNPQVEKNEMMIFLTPRIINQKEAGLSDRG